MLDKIASKTCTKAKKMVDRGKRSKKPNKVKPVESTNNNP